MILDLMRSWNIRFDKLLRGVIKEEMIIFVSIIRFTIRIYIYFFFTRCCLFHQQDQMHQTQMLCFLWKSL